MQHMRIGPTKTIVKLVTIRTQVTDDCMSKALTDVESLVLDRKRGP
jgi:hypothetical protein